MDNSYTTTTTTNNNNNSLNTNNDSNIKNVEDDTHSEVTLTAGSVLYHPAGIWHHVECMTDGRL